MECTCSFNLYSAGLNAFTSSYSVEKYTLPCSLAVIFLRKLDRSHHGADKFSLHKVFSYAISTGKDNYSSDETETPLKAAAKIELFMQNPYYLPGTKTTEKCASGNQ